MSVTGSRLGALWLCSALFSQSSTIYFVLFLNIASAAVTALNPGVFCLEKKKKLREGLSILPAQAVLQDVAEG